MRNEVMIAEKRRRPNHIQGLEDKGEARLATLSAVCKALGTTVHAITAYTAEIDRIRDIDDEAERRRG